MVLKSKGGLKFLLDRKTGQKQVLGVGNHIPTRKNKSVTQSSGSSDQDMPEMQLENGRYVTFTVFMHCNYVAGQRQGILLNMK